MNLPLLCCQMDIIINWLLLSYCYTNRIINLSTLIKLDLIGGGKGHKCGGRERSDDLGRVGEGWIRLNKTQELIRRIKCPNLWVSAHVYLPCCFCLSDVSLIIVERSLVLAIPPYISSSTLPSYPPPQLSLLVPLIPIYQRYHQE